MIHIKKKILEAMKINSEIKQKKKMGIKNQKRLREKNIFIINIIKQKKIIIMKK